MTQINHFVNEIIDIMNDTLETIGQNKSGVLLNTWSYDGSAGSANVLMKEIERRKKRLINDIQ